MKVSITSFFVSLISDLVFHLTSLTLSRTLYTPFNQLASLQMSLSHTFKPTVILTNTAC